MNKRPVAVPLITIDPYFSIWSCSDKLYDCYTKHWTEKPWPIFIGLYVDGVLNTIAGVDRDYISLRDRIYQTDLQITPLSTVYTFENEIAKVVLTFTTPLLKSKKKSFLDFFFDLLFTYKSFSCHFCRYFHIHNIKHCGS